MKDEEKRGGDTAKRRKRGRKPGRGTSPASTEKKDQAEIDIEGERERGSERELGFYPSDEESTGDEKLG